MYKTIIMPVDVFEMELSDKAIRHAEFLAQQDGVIHLLHVLPGAASMSPYTALPPTCAALKNIYSMRRKLAYKRWWDTSASILRESSSMFALVASGTR